MVMPAKTTPITDVHVYKDDPRCLAIRRPATSSNTIIHPLEKNTVALGMRIERKVLDLLILTFPYFVSGKSITNLSTANKSISAAKPAEYWLRVFPKTN
jgi:hypothetical protein